MSELKRIPMPLRVASERIGDFSEAAMGYTREQAILEASRCLDCRNPKCVESCPVGINIPAFIKKIKEEDIDGAYEIISSSSCLPSVCGRVCPQESQCEGKCIRGIRSEPVAIGNLERYAADFHSKTETVKPKLNSHKVAVVGSGPAGLSCSGTLARLGYTVTVFEALHTPGGVLIYGIPEFRLPKAVVSEEIEKLKALGVNFVTDTVIGKTLTVDELFASGYDAVFIGSGAGLPNFMGIEGENLCGVYSANEFLTRVNLMKAYRENSATPIMKAARVAVVGGGNVAMDSARTALRLGADKVYIIYRRSMDELPARREEVIHAQEEGIDFRILSNPTKILGKYDETGGFCRVCGIECVKMTLGAPDASGRRTPVAVENSNFTIDVDCVIMAIGTSPNPLISKTSEKLITNRRGCLVVDENLMTGYEGVFAGGDAVTGAATVILAAGKGKEAAIRIDDYIKNRKNQ